MPQSLPDTAFQTHPEGGVYVAADDFLRGIDLGADDPEPTPEPEPVPEGQFLDGLDDNQQRAAGATDDVIYVVAGPGAGKTRMLTHRLAHLHSQGETGLRACTFTKKATSEMQARLKAMGAQAQIGTLHNLSRAIIKHCEHLVPSLEPAGGFVLARRPGFKHCEVDAHIKMMEGIVRKHGLPRMQNAAESRNPYADAVSQRKAYGRPPRMSTEEALTALQRGLKRTGANPEEVAYALYQAELQAANKFDYDDQVIVSRYLAERYPAETADFLASTSHLMIDEWQDTSHMQYCMVKALKEAKPSLHIFAVGDEDQSIYAFRGADIANAKRLIDELGAVQYRLGVNYRSVPEIVARTQELIQRNAKRMPNPITPHREAQQGLGVFPTDSALTAETMRLCREYGPATVAVIARRWMPLQVLAGELERADIPFYCERYARIENSAVAKDTLAVLHLHANAYLDTSTINRLSKLQGALKGVGKAFLEKWPGASHTPKGKRLAEYIAQRPLDKFTMPKVARFILKGNYLPYKHAPYMERMGQRFMEHCEKVGTVEAFRDSMDPRNRTLGVTLVTAHSAKGLEFQNVIVLNSDFPHPMGDEEEECRLLYVAMTRAQDRLILVSDE